MVVSFMVEAYDFLFFIFNVNLDIFLWLKYNIKSHFGIPNKAMIDIQKI